MLEAVSAFSPSAAAAVYASGAAYTALKACEPAADMQALLQDLACDWLAWPAFHDIDEQLWPAVDAQGYLRGQVDLLLSGAQARWAVLPAQGRDNSLVMVLVAVVAVNTLRKGSRQTPVPPLAMVMSAMNRMSPWATPSAGSSP